MLPGGASEPLLKYLLISREVVLAGGLFSRRTDPTAQAAAGISLAILIRLYAVATM